MMVMMMPAHSLSQILKTGDLTVLRGVREVRGKLVQLVRRRRVTTRLSSLRSGLQVGRDLLRDLLEPRWIRLLQLLQRAHQLS